MLNAFDPTEAKSGLNKSLNVMRFGTPFVLLVVQASDQSQKQLPNDRFNPRPVFFSPLARRYVRDGINRFVTCKYSGGHVLAGMVGYVICDDPDRCVERVQQQLDKESQTITGFDADAGWTASTIWVPSEVLYESHHRQSPSGNRICLVHCYLRVT